MYYYIQLRKSSLLRGTAIREDGKILVFKKYADVEKKVKECKGIIKQCKFHPSNKQSSLYGKKCKVIGG